MANPWFTQQVLNWYQEHGRHDLPWQKPRSPYHVWLSEVMLQQTQVQTVVPYFKRFTQALPTVPALASTSLDHLMLLWSGLGYYRRARFLHQAAQHMVAQHASELPNCYESLVKLPGIGRSTAGAILSIAFEQPYAILDGNVKRVLCRFFAISGWPDAPKTQKVLWPLAQSLTPNEDCHHYTQAIMDLGATCCSRSKPKCAICPLSEQCIAYQKQLCDVLPEKKPKAKPNKKAIHFIVLRRKNGDLLFGKRPSQGIWADMWAFPEQNDDTDVILSEWLPKGVLADCAHTELTSFRHLLTHFELTIKATLIDVDDIGADMGITWQWQSPENFEQSLGVPKPVLHIIQQVQDKICSDPS